MLLALLCPVDPLCPHQRQAAYLGYGGSYQEAASLLGTMGWWGNPLQTCRGALGSAQRCLIGIPEWFISGFLLYTGDCPRTGFLPDKQQHCPSSVTPAPYSVSHSSFGIVVVVLGFSWIWGFFPSKFSLSWPFSSTAFGLVPAPFPGVPFPASPVPSPQPYPNCQIFGEVFLLPSKTAILPKVKSLACQASAKTLQHLD